MAPKKEFIIGYQSVRETLAHQAYRIKHCYLQESRSDQRVQEIYNHCKINHLAVSFLSRKEMDTLIGLSNHQGFALECQALHAKSEAFLEDLLLKKDILLLILDGVQDPHNLGACLRSANAMGVDAVVAPRDRACGLTEVVHKAACGATAHTPFVQVTNLARTLRFLKESSVQLIGMDAHADTQLAAIQPELRLALVMGGEGQGLRRLTRENCDLLVRIPMQGQVKSLNVSIAASIGLYQIRGKNITLRRF